jgi:galactokinase
MHWPPRSPDVTALHFLCVAKVKNEAFAAPEGTIRLKIMQSNKAKLRKVTSYYNNMRNEECKQADRRNFKHL